MENLSIIIPVYNEEETVGETVKFFEDFLEENPNVEVIFINDGSTDKTGQILNTTQNENIKIINQPKNKGYGAAIKRGVMKSSYQYIAITDADGSYPNDKIPDLFKKLAEENADMSVGARTGKVVEIGIFRKFGKYILRKLAEYLSEEEIPDLNSGLRIIKKGLVLKFLRYLPNRFSFTTTLTLSLLANNYKIVYLPIDYYKRRGRSKIKPISDTLNFLQLIVRTVMFFNPLKIFLPLSIFFILLSLSVLVITYFLGRVMDITTILLFVTGLNFLAIGLLADLIDKRLTR
jgi:glycosyltransferase involved in cell wall biosynthesis